MFGKRRTNQGGSVATFVVIGVILTVALIGGLYLVNNRGQQARETRDIAASDTKKTKSNNGEKTQSDTSTDDKKTDEGAENVNPSVNTVGEDSSSQYLPETGLDFNPLQLLGIYFLATSSIAYFLSRRELIRSL